MNSNLIDEYLDSSPTHPRVVWRKKGNEEESGSVQGFAGALMEVRESFPPLG